VGGFTGGYDLTSFTLVLPLPDSEEDDDADDDGDDDSFVTSLDGWCGVSDHALGG